jgi:hypothetical protein
MAPPRNSKLTTRKHISHIVVLTHQSGNQLVSGKSGLCSFFPRILERNLTRRLPQRFHQPFFTEKPAKSLTQLKKIDDFAEARRRNARIYNPLLEDLECVELPPEADWGKNVYWMYSILLKRRLL